MKNVLFVLSSYYPRLSANGVCVKMLAEEYIKRGYRVFCICQSQNLNTKHQTIKGVEVFFINNHLNTLMLEKRLQSKSYIERNVYYTLQRFFSYFLTIETFFSFPISKRMTNSFYKKIKEICLKYNINKIIAVNQPIEAVYSGMLIKEEMPRINLVTYLLDPINGQNKHRFISERDCVLKKKEVEKKVLSASDIVIAQITHKSKLDYLPVNIANKIHFLGVPLLTDQIIHAHKTNNSTDYMLIYAGVIDNKYRPATFIIKAIALSKSIKLKLFLTAGIENVQGLINELKVSNITVHGPIERDLLLKEYEKADCLINIGNTMEDQMPSKIFEYMSYGKPLISTYRIDNDTSKKIVEKYPASLCIDERTDDLETVLKQIEFFLSKRTPRIDFNVLKNIFPEYLPETFVDLVQ